jgi:hypothetical protein
MIIQLWIAREPVREDDIPLLNVAVAIVAPS